jgi:putative FmdB family regulatory protein
MTYEYKCTDPACNYAWEAEQKITEPPQKQCPSCQRWTAQRLISQGAFILNGEGWANKGGY